MSLQRNKAFLKIGSLIVVLEVIASFAFVFGISHTYAAPASTRKGIHGHPRFVDMHKDAPTQGNALKQKALYSTTASTVPTWHSSFTSNGVTYPYTMVGTNPAAGSTSITVPAVIVPLALKYANGVTLDGTTKARSVSNSPLFKTASFASGNTQYGDAIQRAEFWSSVQTHPGYHVLLGQPAILPTVTLKVPANYGQESSSGSLRYAQVDVNWFYNQEVGLITKLHISSTTLPIFLTYNSFLYDSGGCCILGYHDASTLGGKVYTHIFASYIDPGLFGAGTSDVDALSHEVAEWLNDPFVNNIVPNWTTGNDYGCNNDLEVGDPLVGTNFTVNGYSLQDEVLLPWFSRVTSPGTYQARYSFLGTFTHYSASC
ncbi:MAG: hypothetical protein ABI456_15295 [Ktedonobacteraceae bacterium]|nr:hypothetical protein [Chloroflexota bacterium]